jgi:glycosyltransferase involved in cell wall biosynthesis
MNNSSPLWSVMIPTYNGNPEYIRETLESVLVQDPGPEHMQIRLVDNGSTRHDYRKLVEDIGGGRIEYHRHPETVTYLENFNSCIDQARGTLMHLLHDDDSVEPGFYQAIKEAYESHPEVGYIFTRHRFMDEASRVQNLSPLEAETSGIIEKWLDRIAVQQCVYYASVVAPREVYVREGKFNPRFIAAGDDWEMWVRLAAKYPVYFITEPLANVRIHSGSMSRSLFQNGTLISESRKAIEIFTPHLPDDRRKALSSAARDHIAQVGFSYANSCAGLGDSQSAFNLTREAFLTSTRKPAMLIKALESALRAMVSIVRKKKKAPAAAAPSGTSASPA